MRSWLCLVLCFGLAACAGHSDDVMVGAAPPEPVVQAVPPPSAPPQMMTCPNGMAVPPGAACPSMPGGGSVVTSPGMGSIENAQVSRAYLWGDEKYGPAKDNLPFGVILLKRGDDARNMALCNAFVNNLPTTGEVLQADPDANVIATYWLLREGSRNIDLTDCGQLLANYNFGKAQQIRSGYGKASAAGPIFLALQLGAGSTPADVAILDLSRKSPAEVGQITINWFATVVSDSDASAPGQEIVVTAQKKKRGFFGKIIRMAGTFLCDTFSSNGPSGPVAYTQVSFVDPVLNGVSGTLRNVVQGTSILAVGTSLVADFLCPRRT